MSFTVIINDFTMIDAKVTSTPMLSCAYMSQVSEVSSSNLGNHRWRMMG